MRKALFTTLLVSALIPPLAAHADPVDDFTLAGDGHTITYSLPATFASPDSAHFNSFPVLSNRASISCRYLMLPA